MNISSLISCILVFYLYYHFNSDNLVRKFSLQDIDRPKLNFGHPEQSVILQENLPSWYSPQAISRNKGVGMASVVIPGCTSCFKNLAVPGNKPSSEFRETIVSSNSCGHIFHRSCVEKLLGKKKATHCPNKNCLENFQVIDQDLLKEVRFESVASPVAMFEGTIIGYQSVLKETNTKMAKVTNEARKLKEEVTITSAQLESVKNQSLLLADQNDKLQMENSEYIETIKKLKLQKSTTVVPKQTTKIIHESSTKPKIVDIKSEKIDKICTSEPKTKTVKILDENIVKSKVNHDDKSKDIQKKTEEKPESPKVRYTIPRKIDSENTNEAKYETEFITEEKSFMLRKYLEKEEKQAYQSPLHEIEKEVTPRHIQPIQRLTIKPTELRKQREAERALNRENQYNETKKRSLDEDHRQDYNDDIKRQNLSSPLLESCLSPFNSTGRKFGPFLQVMFQGNPAYASDEYLILGDGVIYGILRAAIRSQKLLYDHLLKSPYYFSRKSIKKFDRVLAELPHLPKKIMISIGDIDSVANSNSTFHEIKDALKSLLVTAYCKGVRKIVMIPPIKHDHWHKRRQDLHEILKSKADTNFSWEYHYMEELLDVMSEFTDVVRNADAYYYTATDYLKLMDEITIYTAGIRDKMEEEW